jgi:UDP-glucose 4-epimerase
VFSRAFDLESVILRPFAVYGPGLSPESLIGTVIGQTRRGRVAVLRDLRPVRDFCHVADVADAIARACTAPVRGVTILNVGTGRGTSVAQIARLILRLRGHRIPVRVRPTPPAPRNGTDRLVADPRRARRLLGWRARTPLGAGLRDTMRWMDAR